MGMTKMGGRNGNTERMQRGNDGCKNTVAANCFPKLENSNQDYYHTENHNHDATPNTKFMMAEISTKHLRFEMIGNETNYATTSRRNEIINRRHQWLATI